MSEIERARAKRRSGLYRWLSDNYDEFAPILNEPKAPWADTAAAFRESKGGYEVTRQKVWETWGQVRRAKAKFTRRPPLLPPAGPAQTVTRDLTPHDSRPKTFTYDPTPREDDDRRLRGLLRRAEPKKEP